MKRIYGGTAVLLVIAALLIISGASVYAWLSVRDSASSMEFQFARINSEVYFYTAQDSSRNGVPDLIRDGYAPVQSAEEAHDIYYSEKRYFNYKGKREAVADETAGELGSPIDIGSFLSDLAPSETYTVKLSLVNKGDSTNNVSVRITERTLTDEMARLYATLALRVCHVTNPVADTDQTAAPVIVAGEWVPLASGATVGDDGSVLFPEIILPQITASGDTPSDTFALPGLDEKMKEENADKAVNVADLWLQVRMIPYAELPTSAVSITAEEYQALQKLTDSFTLSFTIRFEVN